MAVYSPVRISGPQTYRLADMGGVLQDLAWAIEACDRLLPRIGKPKENTVELEALESAAIVRYCRCFNTGVRNAFRLNDGWIGRLPAALQAAHEHTYARRDMNIAHSVNDWELNVVTAQLRIDEKAQTRDVVAVHVQHHRMIGLASPDVEALRNLARALSDMIRPEYDAERALLLEIAKSIPVEELERRLIEPAVMPGVGPVDKARGR